MEHPDVKSMSHNQGSSFVRIGSLPTPTSDDPHRQSNRSFNLQRARSSRSRGSIIERIFQRFSRHGSVDLNVSGGGGGTAAIGGGTYPSGTAVIVDESSQSSDHHNRPTAAAPPAMMTNIFTDNNVSDEIFTLAVGDAALSHNHAANTTTTASLQNPPPPHHHHHHHHPHQNHHHKHKNLDHKQQQQQPAHPSPHPSSPNSQFNRDTIKSTISTPPPTTTTTPPPHSHSKHQQNDSYNGRGDSGSTSSLALMAIRMFGQRLQGNGEDDILCPVCSLDMMSVPCIDNNNSEACASYSSSPSSSPPSYPPFSASPSSSSSAPSSSSFSSSSSSSLSKANESSSSNINHHHHSNQNHTTIVLSKLTNNSCFAFCRCHHRACLQCWRNYVTSRIEDFRMNRMTCIACEMELEFHAIAAILELGYFAINKKIGSKLLKRYNKFIFNNCILREPDLRWCPGGCGYAVIAANCDNCPLLYCLHPKCRSMFCYHCRSFWHSGTCPQNRNVNGNDDGIRVTSPNDKQDKPNKPRTRRRFFWRRSKQKKGNNPPGTSSSQAIMTDEGEVKNCPRCQAFVVKANDGSCNHMSCLICGCEFCWLCMQEVTDMHFLSVSGCTFWGKKRWRTSRRIFWQLGTLLGAPIGVAFLGVIAIPAIIFGIPFFFGSKVFSIYKPTNPHKRRAVAVFAALGSLLVSPILAALIVGLGIPTILAYVYIVMPFLMIRSCACWNSCCPLEIEEDEDDQESSIGNGNKIMSNRLHNNGDAASSNAKNTTTVDNEDRESVNKITVDVDINSPPDHAV